MPSLNFDKILNVKTVVMKCFKVKKYNMKLIEQMFNLVFLLHCRLEGVNVKAAT